MASEPVSFPFTLHTEIVARGFKDLMGPVKGLDISLRAQGVAALSAFSGQPISLYCETMVLLD